MASLSPVKVIASRHHALVRRFKAAARGDDPCALVDGWHLLRDAHSAGIPIDVVALTSEAARSPEWPLATACDTTTVVAVTRSVMSAMSPVRTPSGVVALVRRHEWLLDAALTPAPALILVAIDVQDPGNVGALIRASEAGGATGVVCAGASADPWGWKALRAAMGSTFRLPVIGAGDPAQPIEAIVAAGVALVAAVPRDGDPMDVVDFTSPTAILIGGEGAGLPASVVDRAPVRVSVPMAPAVESLNVAVAAALLVYEARRQRAAAAVHRSRSM